MRPPKKIIKYHLNPKRTLRPSQEGNGWGRQKNRFIGFGLVTAVLPMTFFYIIAWIVVPQEKPQA